jgi:hypothetical protein
MRRFPRYKQNLGYQGNNIWCYDSNIARVFSDRLEVREYFKKYSPTTTKHYNYVSSYYKLPIVFVNEFSSEVYNEQK